MSFQENFRFLFIESGCSSDDLFGDLLEMGRWTVNKLKNGNRSPSNKQLFVIGKYCGVDPNDLLLDLVDFKKIYFHKNPTGMFMFNSLRLIQSNLSKCRECFEKYQGQFVIYTNTSSTGIVIASLLEVHRVSKSGIEFSMINPYTEDDGRYDAFRYTGYMMQVDELLYFVGEQSQNNYEILTMLFHTSGAPKAGMLRGIWTGVGVKNGRKSIASVSALAVRPKHPIVDWEAALDKELGYLKIGRLPLYIQKKLSQDIVIVDE